MTERSDEELMLAYASGDARAFEALYSRHRGPLFRFLLRGIKRRELADELFQEVWGRVVQARTRYRVEAKFSTWLLQIAHNLVIDQYRRERPEDNGETAENAFRVAENDEHERPDRVLSDFEQSRRLQDALAELPADQRGAFLLRVENGLGIEEIGEVMGVGRETAKSRLRYALEKLRVSLRSYA
ncbi:MAG TPA: RNA polymerase sigma factor [Pseudomonadota bacterium]|nr:RNA polymerase sigma factor [Rhodanobacteraceae bacterium]MBP9153843.1 RNA polymerase sigma factor [Xanthomonadales bacterium]HQW80685.1 RNA polymerase sigma factor [Pseudomonadota bacterium]